MTKNCLFSNNCNHIDCDKDCCMRELKLSALFKNALFSDEQSKYKPLVLDLDNKDAQAFTQLSNMQKDIVNFINSGYNVFIHSTIAGNGKTSWALRLVQAYFNKSWSKLSTGCHALFISVPALLVALKDNITKPSEYVQYIKDNVYKCDVVIWDDCGTKSATSFEHENLFSMIDSRINSGLSNIFTSNLTDSEMQQALGDRLASRICNNSYNIELKGADKRGLVL